MSNIFDVDIDKIASDYEAADLAIFEKYIKECTEKNDELLKKFTYKLEEHHQNLKQRAITKKELDEMNRKIHHVCSEKLKTEKELLESQKSCLELLKINCNELELSVKNKQLHLNEVENQLNHVVKENKDATKNIKTETKLLKYGVNMYENHLQLSTKIEKKKQDEIHVSLISPNCQINYCIIFVEFDSKSLELKDILPQADEAVKLFNRTKSFKSLLTFLWNKQTHG